MSTMSTSASSYKLQLKLCDR